MKLSVPYKKLQTLNAEIRKLAVLGAITDEQHREFVAQIIQHLQAFTNAEKMFLEKATLKNLQVKIHTQLFNDFEKVKPS